MGELYLLVGLGNPGARYQKMRHNIGFMVVDSLLERGGSASELRCGCVVARLDVGGDNRVILAKPQTYMNRSGEGVAALVDELELPKENLLVIFDDFNLPLGKLRIRPRGGDGGHNGLKSIIDCLQTSEFARLRVGIGSGSDFDPIEFVLSDFLPDEKSVVGEAVELAAEAALYFVENGITKTMNQYN